jgi:hypothetical protein
MSCHVYVTVMDRLGAVTGLFLAFAWRAVNMDSDVPVSRPCVLFEKLPSRFAAADAAALHEGATSLRNM